MNQHNSSEAIGASLTEQEMALVTGGDGSLWNAVGYALGYVAGQIVKLNDVAQNPMSAGYLYNQ